MKLRTGFYVRDVMTKNPIGIQATASVYETARLMKAEDIGSLIVFVEGRIAGIVTQKDIVQQVVAKGSDPKKITARKIMSSPVVTISAGEDIVSAITLMNRHRIRQLPVVQDDALKGYLTLNDILKVEPELIEIAMEAIELREEIEKPVRKRLESGDCDACGGSSKELLEIRDVLLCPSCRGALRPVL